VDIALDLLPAAREGDEVLVHAGVALSVVCEPGAAPAAATGVEEA
jgi:hydrogenase maturation factor